MGLVRCPLSRPPRPRLSLLQGALLLKAKASMLHASIYRQAGNILDPPCLTKPTTVTVIQRMLITNDPVWPDAPLPPCTVPRLRDLGVATCVR